MSAVAIALVVFGIAFAVIAFITWDAHRVHRKQQPQRHERHERAEHRRRPSPREDQRL